MTTFEPFAENESGMRQVVDGVIEAYRTGRVRLWLTNLADAPSLVEELGPWAGLVRVSAEAHARKWEPDPQEVMARLSGRPVETLTPGVNGEAIRQLLPLAREEFGRALESKNVPRKVVERAKSLFSLDPPVQQWKM